MKKLLLLLVIVAAVFVVINRQRLFVRDPMGVVVRNGLKEDGAQVFINYSSDVMVENDTSPMYIELIAHDNHTGVPQQLKCVHFIACLTDADLPTLLPSPSGIKVHAMDSRKVWFADGARETTVTLY